ncbi:hypothetical protein KIK06_11675 [Nocardiopsis sp. EMB25]|uniref:hypothetical protein n=1 Tax=Nocardiopsis sp. EMB25 TaxID=2835867 RepID=UPI002283DE17|nr:hypothetical protein [Nocardiopsis sp. EMB25]MCY9784551.1 hypothetical protein [Nocardiopsis sp. EMB25]
MTDMKPRALAACGVTLLVALASTSCSGMNSRQCRNGDCTVVVVGAQYSGDLRDTKRVDFEFEIAVADDQSAEVTVEREEERTRRDEEESATLRPGESAELMTYSVEYVSHNADGATFEFTRTD